MRTGTDIRTIIAPLFVPATRPDRIAKAAASGADGIILDLEDAVPPADKAKARIALCGRYPNLPVIVRINAVGTPWHEADLAAAVALGAAAIILPKAEQVRHVAALSAYLPVIALIETARGIASVREIAACGQVARLAFGSVDYAADLGCAHERLPLATARAEVVLASRLGGVAPPLDGVTTNVANPEAAGEDAAYASSLGFGGKLAIHPSQVAPIMAGFRPSDAEFSWACRVLAVHSDEAVRVDGEMVDAPVRARASLILKRAGSKRRANEGRPIHK